VPNSSGILFSYLLATSRQERDIEIILWCFIEEQHRVCLQNDLVDVDIRAYVEQRLSDDGALRKWQKDGIRQEIEDALMNGARGMCHSPFLWTCKVMLTMI
jgi:hypothetical protein